MNNEIKSIMHDISVNEPGLYSGLFGYEGFEILKTKKIFWAIKNDNDRYESIKIFMDYLIFTILNQFGNSLDIDNIIELNGFQYENPFAIKGGLYVDDMLDYSFCDLENLDLNTQIVGDMIIIDMILPIYNLEF